MMSPPDGRRPNSIPGRLSIHDCRRRSLPSCASYKKTVDATFWGMHNVNTPSRRRRDHHILAPPTPPQRPPQPPLVASLSGPYQHRHQVSDSLPLPAPPIITPKRLSLFPSPPSSASQSHSHPSGPSPTPLTFARVALPIMPSTPLHDSPPPPLSMPTSYGRRHERSAPLLHWPPIPSRRPPSRQPSLPRPPSRPSASQPRLSFARAPTPGYKAAPFPGRRHLPALPSNNLQPPPPPSSATSRPLQRRVQSPPGLPPPPLLFCRRPPNRPLPPTWNGGTGRAPVPFATAGEFPHSRRYHRSWHGQRRQRRLSAQTEAANGTFLKL